MTAKACLHPFPFKWHRTVAEVDKAAENRSFCVAFFDGNAKKNAAPEGVGTACPEPDQNAPSKEVAG